jgi:phage tail-like protein
MAETELPALVIDAVAAIVASSRPLLTNRDPSPGEPGVPLASVISLELLDPGADGVDRGATRVWVDGVPAFDGASIPPILPAFAGPHASVLESVDTLRIVLDPLLPSASQARVAVRVSSATRGSAPSLLDETYAFEIEDRTAPRLVAGLAIDARTVRLAFDEHVAVVDASAITLAALDTPAIPLNVVNATAANTIVDVTVSTEMTPDARYLVRAAGVADVAGNPTAPPFMGLVVTGYRSPRPARRRFDLWSMLPKHNRRGDTTGDLARFIACLQEITDLLLAEIDRFAEIFDLERAPPQFLDLVLRDLGNPFPFDLDTLGKRRLAAVLVEMYRQKGTASGVRNAVRFFLGINITAITGLAESALVLGVSELGIDWELGPSDRFARYAFSIVVARALSATERKQLRAIVEYLKPAHTHFVDLVEPGAPFVADDWEIGVSELGVRTLLH